MRNLIDQIYRESEKYNLEKEGKTLSDTENNQSNTYLDNLAKKNRKTLDEAKGVFDKYSQNRKKIQDDLIELNKSVLGLENPYLTLEKALKIIEKLIGDKTGLIQFQKSVEVVRAQILKDENAKMYELDNLDGLIQKIEANKEITESIKYSTLSELKRKKALLGDS